MIKEGQGKKKNHVYPLFIVSIKSTCDYYTKVQTQ